MSLTSPCPHLSLLSGPYLLSSFFWLFLFGLFLVFSILLLLLCLLFGSQLFSDLKEAGRNGTGKTHQHPAGCTLSSRASQRSLSVLRVLLLQTPAQVLTVPRYQQEKADFSIPNLQGFYGVRPVPGALQKQNILMTHSSKLPLHSEPDNKFVQD